MGCGGEVEWEGGAEEEGDRDGVGPGAEGWSE